MMLNVQHPLRIVIGVLMLWNLSVHAQYIPAFDGAMAFDLLKQQVAWGPRYPGSAGHDSLVHFMQQYLEPRARQLRFHTDTLTHPYRGTPLPITNVLARFNLSMQERVLLLAHYDTREIADEDPDPANRSQPILGANDGASGVAVLLTLADMFAREAPPIGVDLLFVDAEDIGRSGDLDSYCLGTKAFLPVMSEYLEGVRPRYGVLVDMIGDANLTLPMEYYSWRDARRLILRIWDLANELGFSQFQYIIGPAIYDDHIPLLEAGLPVVDIIDMEYPDAETNYWHTLADTPDKCSAESLEAVGTVLATLIYTEVP
ncbi:M28 family peptidase [Candidatus Neomarinimicrobiota bacterium]